MRTVQRASHRGPRVVTSRALTVLAVLLILLVLNTPNGLRLGEA